MRGTRRTLWAAAAGLVLGTTLVTAGCTPQPRDLDSLLSDFESSADGLHASTYESSSGSNGRVVVVDTRHMEGADAALADELVADLAERIDRAGIPMPETWTYLIHVPGPDGTVSGIRLRSDTDPTLRREVLEVVSEAGCGTDDGDDDIHVSCSWQDSNQTDGLERAQDLLAALPTDLSPFAVKTSFDDYHGRVQAPAGYTEEHLRLLEVTTAALVAQPQDEVSIVLGPRAGDTTYDAYISVLDADTAFAPALQAIIDESPLLVDTDIIGRDGLPSIELVPDQPT